MKKAESFAWLRLPGKSSRPAAARRHRNRPQLEILEDRHLLTTFNVLTNADNGSNVNPTAGSLRKAILDANNNPGQDFIQFKIGNGGVFTIAPPAPLPAITDTVSINGYSQKGASMSSLPQGDNAILCIVLDGNAISGTPNGLTINASSCTIQGLNIQRFGGNGIYVTGSSNHISGNFIGTDVTGASKRGNGQCGLHLVGGQSNVVGLSTPGGRNIISGNGLAGINVEGPQVYVQGNFIGTNASGTAKLGNGGAGVVLNNDSIVVGGGPGAGNVIGGNVGDGILLQAVEDSVIQGNSIGISLFGANLGNGAAGIRDFGGSVTDNLIGGDGAAGNIIAFNGAPGGIVLASNDSSRNIIWGNSIFGNTGLGIDLGQNGITPNDSGDGDPGPNLLQNYPVLSAASVGKAVTTIAGSLNSKKNSQLRIELFGNASPAAQTFLGKIVVFTDADGNAPIFFTTSTLLVGGTVTATATDSEGNTSEFSAPVAVSQPALGSANLNFVYQAYIDVLHRPADPSGLAAFSSLLNSGGQRFQVVAAMTTSSEYRALVITDLFNRLLNRAPDPGALAFFSVFLVQGGSAEQVRATIVSSDEYFTFHGGSVAGFLDAIFGDVLGRQADANGLAYFGGQIAAGASRSSVATQMVSSTEAAQLTVGQLFQQYLHRSADAAARMFFSSQLQSGLRDEQLVGEIVASDEYFSKV